MQYNENVRNCVESQGYGEEWEAMPSQVYSHYNEMRKIISHSQPVNAKLLVVCYAVKSLLSNYVAFDNATDCPATVLLAFCWQLCACDCAVDGIVYSTQRIDSRSHCHAARIRRRRLAESFAC